MDEKRTVEIMEYILRSVHGGASSFTEILEGAPYSASDLGDVMFLLLVNASAIAAGLARGNITPEQVQILSTDDVKDPEVHN